MLQHTPDPLAAFASVVTKTRQDGRVVIWNYEYRWWNWLTPRFWWRTVIPHLSPQQAYEFIRIYAPIALGLRRLARKIPYLGRKLQKFIFLCDYEEIYPELNEAQLYEWALLDTYDSLATRYENCLPAQAYIRKGTAMGFPLSGQGTDGSSGSALRFQKL